MLENDSTARVMAREERIIDALAALRRSATPALRMSVREEIEAYVDSLRDGQAQPEHMVIALKAVIQRAGFIQSVDGSQRLTSQENGLIADEFITWGIMRFFGSTSPSHVSRHSPSGDA